MATSCTLGNLFCTISAVRGPIGDPIKPAYYIDAWATLAIVIVVFFVGRLSARKK